MGLSQVTHGAIDSFIANHDLGGKRDFLNLDQHENVASIIVSNDLSETIDSMIASNDLGEQWDFLK